MSRLRNIARAQEEIVFQHGWSCRSCESCLSRGIKGKVDASKNISLKKEQNSFRKAFCTDLKVQLRYCYAVNQYSTTGDYCFPPTSQHTRRMKTTKFLEFDDLGFLLRRVFLAVYASWLTKHLCTFHVRKIFYKRNIFLREMASTLLLNTPYRNVSVGCLNLRIWPLSRG